MDDRVMTWSALLGKWTEFAKAGLALPTDGAGGRWRRVIAPVIGLQAVTHALSELDQIEDPGERAAGLDRAEMIVKTHASEVHGVWSGEPLPMELQALVDDARLAVRAAERMGFEWLVESDTAAFDHPGVIAEALVTNGFVGDVYLPTPGVPLFRGSAVAFVGGVRGGAVDPDMLALVGGFVGADDGESSGPSRRSGARQVYRQFDFASGGPVRDVIAPLDGEPLPGQPLLIAAVLGGETQPVPLPPRMPHDLDILPVEEHRSDA